MRYAYRTHGRCIPDVDEVGLEVLIERPLTGAMHYVVHELGLHARKAAGRGDCRRSSRRSVRNAMKQACAMDPHSHVDLPSDQVIEHPCHETKVHDSAYSVTTYSNEAQASSAKIAS